MAAKKKGGKQAPRPRSGFVTEEQRHTVRVVLRLKPEVADLLYSLATEIGKPGKADTYAETVRQALEALNREMNAESEENALYCPHDVMIGAGICDECAKENAK